MFVIVKEGIENGENICNSGVAQGNIREIVQIELERISEKGYSYTPVNETGNIILVTGNNTQHRMCMYETGNFAIEPKIVSAFYHLRADYYVEVMRDTLHGKVIVYLYIAGILDAKTEIAQMELSSMTEDDDDVIAGVLLAIEDKIQQFENLLQKDSQG